MFCTVYVLRYLGNRMTPADGRYMSGRVGMLMYGPDHRHEMRATLYDLETEGEVMFLSRAVLRKAGHGGMLLAGYDVTYRGLKSNGEYHRQSWWCVPMTKVVLPPQPPAPLPDETAAG